MKRSLSVPLLFLGTLGLTGCGPQPLEQADVPIRQDFYTSATDCRNDWGNEAEHCQPTQPNSASGTGGHGSSVYAGPRYYWDHGSGRPFEVMPSGQTRPIIGSNLISPNSTRASSSNFSRGTVSVARGGFGGFGGGHASSGG